MKDTDRILISSYIDGELDNDETLYVETLIKNDEQARMYLNHLKIVKNEVEAFFTDSIETEEFNSVSEFLESKKEKSIRKQTSKNMSALLSWPKAIPVYSLAAILMLSIGLNSYFFFESNKKSLSLSEFSNTLVDRNIMKTRGLNDSYKKVFGQTILSMYKEKNTSTRLRYGEEVFLIKINKLTLKEEKVSCFDGDIKKLNEINHFVFCVDEQEEYSILLSNN